MIKNLNGDDPTGAVRNCCGRPVAAATDLIAVDAVRLQAGQVYRMQVDRSGVGLPCAGLCCDLAVFGRLTQYRRRQPQPGGSGIAVGPLTDRLRRLRRLRPGQGNVVGALRRCDRADGQRRRPTQTDQRKANQPVD